MASRVSGEGLDLKWGTRWNHINCMYLSGIIIIIIAYCMCIYIYSCIYIYTAVYIYICVCIKYFWIYTHVYMYFLMLITLYMFAYWHIEEQGNVVCVCFHIRFCPPLDSQLMVWVGSEVCDIWKPEAKPLRHYVIMCIFSHRLSLSNLFFGGFFLLVTYDASVDCLLEHPLTLGIPSGNLT